MGNSPLHMRQRAASAALTAGAPRSNSSRGPSSALHSVEGPGSVSRVSVSTLPGQCDMISPGFCKTAVRVKAACPQEVLYNTSAAPILVNMQRSRRQAQPCAEPAGAGTLRTRRSAPGRHAQRPRPESSPLPRPSPTDLVAPWYSAQTRPNTTTIATPSTPATPRILPVPSPARRWSTCSPGAPARSETCLHRVQAPALVCYPSSVCSV